MLAKFLLIIYIGKYLSIDELGEYGLFVITVTIAIYFLGLDFYTYNSREILAKEEKKRLALIRDQFIFHLLVYVVVLPLLLSVFLLGLIDIEYLLYFYLILVFEHLSQELYRLYTTLKKPIFANFLLFLRTGLWVYAILILWISEKKETMNLETVWVGWLIGSLLSIMIGVVYLKKEYDRTILSKKIDWKWIKNGIKVSIPFFIGTLAYKVIEFSDRYMIDYYMTKADVGIYTFFSGIANTVNIIVFTLVIMVYYPLLVEQYQQKKNDLFEKTLKIFSQKTMLYSLASCLLIFGLIGFVLDFMGKVEFHNHIDTLWVLVIANIILNISFVAHYILYAAQKDIVIRNATLVGAGVNILLNIILIPYYGIVGAALATLISYTVIFMIKYHKSKLIVIK